ncbi:MAG: LL-diaminopimelate aminotransferase [Parachlamydiaceae bacterium]
MTKRNSNFNKLKSNYLFPEINQRKQQFLARHPGVSLISLGIGDTTEPISPHITNGLVLGSSRLATADGYQGYGPEQGMKVLRERVAATFYPGLIRPEDVFVSDGAKCDLGRLQTLFGRGVSIAVQDAAYPVYVDGSLILGVENIVLMPCPPENNFFPILEKMPRTDLIYFCSPNNPTGAVATRAQLQSLVAFAKANRSIIIFDSAYSHYIQDPSLPRSIFEIPGAEEVAIEVGSFSKIAGFTGVRLGWTVVPEQLKYEDGFSVRADWNRLMSTLFNGASNIAQWGGCAVLEKEGLEEIDALRNFYMENTRLLKESLDASKQDVFGGENAPYLWVRFKGKSSWDIFQYFLEELHLVVTPGVGFGSGGEGFIRLAAFGHRENILQAAKKLKTRLCTFF